MKLDEIKTTHPWPEKWKSYRPVEYFTEIDIVDSVENIWSILSDTSIMNERMGLAKMSFVERDGKKYGTNRVAGVNQQWEEVPWEWEENIYLKSERIFTKGLTRYTCGLYFITPLSINHFKVSIYFGMIPSSFKNRTLLKIAKKSFLKKFRDVLIELLEEKKSNILPLNFDPALLSIKKQSENIQVDKRRVLSIKSELLSENLNVDIVDRLVNLILFGDDMQLYRMRPIVIAKSAGFDKLEVIRHMLIATNRGLLNMTWDIICPHCKGVREKINHLWEVGSRGKCEVCDIDFETTGLNGIEITFHPNPDIRGVEEVLYCSAEPAKKSHIKFQKEMGAGEEYILKKPLETGRYRMRIQGEQTYLLVDIQSQMENRTFLWDNETDVKSTELGIESKIMIANNDTMPKTFIIEENREDGEALRPRDIFNIQEFRELFSEEALAEDLSIDVGIQNILFVDVEKSTELYQKVGDSKAFTLMRKYFQKSYELTRKYGGSIVKTIGDALLIAFNHPGDAIKCATKFLSFFNGENESIPIRVRVTVNRGPCLAVNLNSSIDYFGQAVNITAKLQKFTSGGEMAATEEFLNDETVLTFLKSRGIKLNHMKEADIKGAGSILYSKFRVKSKKI